MSPQRRARIMESLSVGNMIYRHWKGGNRSGYLSHSLSGIKNLRESEVDELRRDFKLELDPGTWGRFRPLVLQAHQAS